MVVCKKNYVDFQAFSSDYRFVEQHGYHVCSSVDSTAHAGWIFGPFPVIRFLESKFQVSLFGHVTL